MSEICSEKQSEVQCILTVFATTLAFALRTSLLPVTSDAVSGVSLMKKQKSTQKNTIETLFIVNMPKRQGNVKTPIRHFVTT